jgi:hypothetical protein
MGNQGWLHRSCGLRARRKRSRGQAERADGKPECGELYRGGPRLSGPIHRRFSLFAQKNSEVGAATPTSKGAIPASPPLFTLIGRRTSAHRPGWRAPGGPATTLAACWKPPLFDVLWLSIFVVCTAVFSSHIGIVGARAALRRCPDDVLGSASLLSAQVCMGKPVTCWDSWGRNHPAAGSRRYSGSDP